MMQSPGMLMQFLALRPMVPTMLVSPPQPQNEELLLAVEEADFNEKMNDIRKKSTQIIVIGKISANVDKEEDDNDADDDDPDNADDSEGDEFEQENHVNPTLIRINQMPVLSLCIFNVKTILYLPDSPPLSR